MLQTQSQELGHETLLKLLELVHKHSGITMNSGKKALLQGRLRPRIRDLGLSGYEAYVTYLSTHKEEEQEFINIITTNETTFFRTNRVWEHFMKEFLPTWFGQNPQKTLMIWSGASSSGEEIYTIGICCEDFRQRNRSFNYQILGTDICTEVLQTAQTGVYSGRSIENFQKSYPVLFERFMKPVDGKFQVCPEVMSRTKFSRHNLFHRPPQKLTYDVVFLRNVMIYFDPEDQQKVVENISHSLLPKGTLIIGESESLGSLKTSFSLKVPLVYQKD